MTQCSSCRTVLHSASTDSSYQLITKISHIAPLVCHHCHHANVVDLTPLYWLHCAMVEVTLNGLEDVDVNGPTYRLLIETNELQELFTGTSEEAKARAFSSNQEFKA